MPAMKSKQEIAIVFVWNDLNLPVREFVKYAEAMLSRDEKRPFSREIDLPLFFYPGRETTVPATINVTASKVIVVVIADSATVIDEAWSQYYKRISAVEHAVIVPIAFEQNAFIKERDFVRLNHIRAYDFEDANKNEELFIWLAHEIYRHGFNEKLEQLSEKSALKIFISHAKDKSTGENVAQKLKNYLDHSTIKNFFDTCSIGPGFHFDEEIKNSIAVSSVVLINSDIYSSRHWCQKEVIIAKKLERPIIEVDALEEGVDRKFPYASNIPIVRINLADGLDEKEILKILTGILVETVRFYYTKMKLQRIEKNNNTNIKICYRPPEISDIEKIVVKDKNKCLQCKAYTIIYPDPPVYSEEIEFLEKLGIKTVTPATQHSDTLAGKTIGISISEISQEELLTLGQNKTHLIKFSQMVFRYLIGLSAFLVYGGDLRPDGFTEYLTSEAKLLKERLQIQEPCIKNYLSWPIYLKDTDEVKRWKASHKEYIKTVEVAPWEKVTKDRKKFLVPNIPENLYLWARSLTKMRREMISGCDARIVAGGKLSGYKGRMPGVLEELLIAGEYKIPFYLIGGFGGAAKAAGTCIFDSIVPAELTNAWQIAQTPNIEGVMDFYAKAGEPLCYTDIVAQIKKLDFNNGLSDKENEILFHSVYIEEIIELVLKGMSQNMEE